MHREGQCVINDLIRGEVTFEWAGEQDHVIQRGDGSCLYHLASVIDDHDFAITHVVRAEEHLSNTPRQIFILESLGYDRPAYAHLPYVAEPGGSAKLSKRKLDKYEKNKDFASLLTHGRAIAERCGIATAADTFSPVIVDFYREIGFDAEAILNYLLLLGWSLDGETEKFTVDEMVKHFTLERVNKSPASFDPRKLTSFQGDYFAALPAETRLARARPFAEAAGLLVSDDAEATLKQIVECSGDRMKMAGDILDFDYFFVDTFEFDDKAFQKRICKPGNARDLLAGFRDAIAGGVTWTDADSAGKAVHTFCESAGVELGDTIHALRVAATGSPAGFGMFDTLAILGCDRVAVRIGKALDHAATNCSGA
jgi:glutamyl-tRNA synthetase